MTTIQTVEQQAMEPDTSVSQQLGELERLYNTAPIGLCFLDSELRYIRINERLAMMNGKPAAAHIGRPIREVIPELAPTLEPIFRELLETGVPVRDLEVRRITPADVAERTWLYSFYRVTSIDGRVLGVSNVVQEVTEPKQVAEELALLGEYLDTILLNLPVGIAILEGEDFRYFRINKTLANMNGLSVEDHLGKTFAQVLPDAQNILPNLRKVRDEGKATGNREFTIRLPSNPDKDVHLMDFHFPITVAGKTKAVGAVVLDITARKHAEDALQKAHEQLEQQVKDRTAEVVQANTALRAENTERRETQKALEESEQRLRMLLETTHAIPWSADAKTFQFTYVGPRAVELLGYPTDQWYVDDFWPEHVHPDDRDAALDFCLASAQHLAEYEFEYRMITADGHVVWIRDLVNVVCRDGEPATLHGFMIDVTAEKAAQQSTRLLQEELAHVTRIATAGEFAGSLAHEINQPLAAIAANAQAARRFLDRPTPDTDEASEALNEIAEDAKRAGEVIHRLRQLFEKREPQKDRLDINALVSQVGTLLQSDATARGISMRLDLATNLPQLLGDRVQLQQVVMNLILNGFEAMTENPPSGVNELTVSTARRDEDLIVVAVQDSGCGLDPDLGERIFEAFITTKPGGMGMGLSISRSIVEAHRGQIWVTQNPDRGVTLRFTVPVARVANA